MENPIESESFCQSFLNFRNNDIQSVKLEIYSKKCVQFSGKKLSPHGYSFSTTILV